MKTINRFLIFSFIFIITGLCAVAQSNTNASLYEFEEKNGTFAILNKMNISDNQFQKETPEELVQRQVEAYNARDLEAFMATFSEDVVINYFPEKTRYKDKAAMRERFVKYFANTPDLHCEIKNRITISNKVIDEEYILANGKYRSAVAVYEVEDGLIKKVTFIY